MKRSLYIRRYRLLQRLLGSPLWLLLLLRRRGSGPSREMLRRSLLLHLRLLRWLLIATLLLRRIATLVGLLLRWVALVVLPLLGLLLLRWRRLLWIRRRRCCRLLEIQHRGGVLVVCSSAGYDSETYILFSLLLA